MRRPLRRRASLVAVALVSLAVTGCGGGQQPDSPYTFHQPDAGLDVDTSALRALKSSAGIEPCPSTGSTSGVDGGLPDLILPCLGGGRDVDLAGLRGPLLLNFWAQYCGPCRTESPLFEKLATSAQGKVRVIGVDFLDPLPGKALAFAKDLGLTYPQIADPVGAAKAPLRIPGLPWTFFVDGDGKIVYTQTGAITSAGQLAGLVHDHLGVAVPGLTRP